MCKIPGVDLPALAWKFSSWGRDKHPGLLTFTSASMTSGWAQIYRCRNQYGCSLWGLALLLRGCRLPWLKVGPAFCSEDFSRGFINQPARQPLSCWDVIFKAQLKINCRLTLILSHRAWVSLSQSGTLAKFGSWCFLLSSPRFFWGLLLLPVAAFSRFHQELFYCQVL